MPIRYVSKKQFDTFDPPRVDETTTEEVEWFADDEGVVIGVITCDKSSSYYSIAVLGRDQHGQVRTFAEATFSAVDDARRTLLARMERALATGLKIFRQGD